MSETQGREGGGGPRSPPLAPSLAPPGSEAEQSPQKPAAAAAAAGSARTCLPAVQEAGEEEEEADRRRRQNGRTRAAQLQVNILYKYIKIKNPVECFLCNLMSPVTYLYDYFLCNFTWSFLFYWTQKIHFYLFACIPQQRYQLSRHIFKTVIFFVLNVAHIELNL